MFVCNCIVVKRYYVFDLTLFCEAYRCETVRLAIIIEIYDQTVIVVSECLFNHKVDCFRRIFA